MENSTEQISLSAKNYSQALVKIAGDNLLSFEEISDNLNKISEIIEMSEDLKNVFENPAIPSDAKKEIADEVFQKDINPKIINFIKVLIDKKRFNEFNQIKTDLAQKIDEINNIQTVEIISAIPLNSEYQELIQRKLGEKLQKYIRPIWKLDENIIAGLVFKISDDVIDTSLRSKLEKLNKSLMLK